MKTKQSKSNRQKRIMLIAGGVLVVLLVAQIVFDSYAYRSLTRPDGQSTITNLIISAVEGLSKPAQVDPTTGNVYLTDDRLVLPASTDTHLQLRYNNSGGTGTDAAVEVTSSNILSQAEAKLWTAQSASSGWNQNPSAVFNEVPSLQACARGVQLFYQAKDDYGPQFVLQDTKVLANGKALYVYTEKTCKVDLTQLVDYVKNVQSY